MYNDFNRGPKQSHRGEIEKYISESIIYKIIQSNIISNRSIRFPTNLDQLPNDHFLIKMARNPNSRLKSSNLRAFISPGNLMKQYNRKNSKYKFSVAEVFYYFSPNFDNNRFQNNLDAKQFFFEVRNLQKEKNKSHLIEKNISNIMTAYLKTGEVKATDSAHYQNIYVIPIQYCPLILIKVKYEFELNYSTRSGFQYLIFNYDQYETNQSKGALIRQQVQEKKKKQLDIIRKKKTQERSQKINPVQISKKDQLKSVYQINSFSIGCINKQSYPKNESKQIFDSYFDIQTLEKNLNQTKGNSIKTKNYVFLKKGQYQIPRIQIISILYDSIVCKCVFKLNEIKKISIFSKTKQVYFHVNNYPQFYFHILERNVGNNIYNLNPWNRVENFPIQYQKNIKNSHFMKAFLSQNSVICMDFQVSNRQFKKLKRYFRAQQILEVEYLNEFMKPRFLSVQSYHIYTLETRFNQLLKNIKIEDKITVHQIKFSLLSLNYMPKMKITCQDITELLQKIEKEYPRNIQKYKYALIKLCQKPHQLLTKDFPNVFSKLYKIQQLLQMVASNHPKIQNSQLNKLGQFLLQDDAFSQASDISSISQISQVATQFFMSMGESKTIQKTRNVLLPNIKLTPNGVIYAGWTQQVASKILKEYSEFQHQFLKVQICDQHSNRIVNAQYLLQKYIRKQMDNIQILNEEYIPLGWSQSQLKQGELWYTLNSKTIKNINRDKILNFLGDFNENTNPKLANPALKAARIGQSFTSSWSFDAQKIKFSYQNDIFADKQQQKNYTDGIGHISKDVMEEFRLGLKLDTLAAVQIRYKGIKGLVSLNGQLKQQTAVIRKSMVKYNCEDSLSVKYFDIIDYSKYKVGYLNRQIIVLLIANGISSSQIVSIQRQYIKLLQKDVLDLLFQNISFQDESIDIFQRQFDKEFQSISEVFKMILYDSYEQKDNDLNKVIYDQSFFKAFKIQSKRRLLSRLKQKCRIRVEKSVRLFGILDQFKVLKQYEVYCSIHKNFQSYKQNITDKCILTKNPCLHPADIRVVQCVSDIQIKKRLRQKGKNPNLFQDLVNVIIFPQQGKNPLTIQISQSDLDGDEFFLSWDPRLIPYRQKEPFIIAEQVPFKQRKITGSGYSQMLDFFIQFQNSNKLGKLANSHLIQADIYGANSKQCIQLCKIHSVAVQYPKRGYQFLIDEDLLYHMYPHYMQKQFPMKSYRSQSVLATLYNQVLKESNLKDFNNKSNVCQNVQKNFDILKNTYLDHKLLQKSKQNLNNKLLVLNKVINRYQNDIQNQDKQTNEDQTQPLIAENEEPISGSQVKKQYQVENKNLFELKKIPFSQQSLMDLQSFINQSIHLKAYDSKKTFSLLEILSTFNYLCAFIYQLNSLSQLLQSEHESVYTIYFELHTSSKNSTNLLILDRIKQFRQKWLTFFGEQLIKQGCFKNIDDFQKFYFKNIIEKKPQFQNTVKNFQKMNEKMDQKGFRKTKIQNLINQNNKNNLQFVSDQIHNLSIVSKSVNYDTYTYQNAKDLPALIYRKLILFYTVSTYFEEIIQDYNFIEFSKIATSYYRAQLSKYKSLHSLLGMNIQSLKTGLEQPIQLFKKNQLDFLGFTWFCLPKLMVVWWKTIIQEKVTREKKQKQDKRENQMNFQSKQLQEIKTQKQMNEKLLQQRISKLLQPNNSTNRLHLQNNSTTERQKNEQNKNRIEHLHKDRNECELM